MRAVRWISDLPLRSCFRLVENHFLLQLFDPVVFVFGCFWTFQRGLVWNTRVFQRVFDVSFWETIIGEECGHVVWQTRAYVVLRFVPWVWVGLARVSGTFVPVFASWCFTTNHVLLVCLGSYLLELLLKVRVRSILRSRALWWDSHWAVAGHLGLLLFWLSTRLLSQFDDSLALSCSATLWFFEVWLSHLHNLIILQEFLDTLDLLCDDPQRQIYRFRLRAFL